MSRPTARRLRAVTDIAIASGVIALLCILIGAFLLYSTLAAPDPAPVTNVKLLALVGWRWGSPLPS